MFLESVNRINRSDRNKQNLAISAEFIMQTGSYKKVISFRLICLFQPRLNREMQVRRKKSASRLFRYRASFLNLFGRNLDAYCVEKRTRALVLSLIVQIAKNDADFMMGNVSKPAVPYVLLAEFLKAITRLVHQ